MPGAAEQLCVHRNPDGTLSFRYLLNGSDFDDYLRVLNPGERLRLLAGYTQDFGGVHDNSAIWNNALWCIRTGSPRSTASPATPRRSRTPSTAPSTAR